MISILLDEMPARGTDGLTEIPIAVMGTWKRDGGEFTITRQDLAMIAANFRKRKNGEINVDYDHASEMPEVARGGPVLSAGRILKLRSNGALYAGIEFTARALQLINGKEYRFVSPAIVWGMKDKTTGADQGATLTSLALTNRPFLEELPSIKLSEIGSGYSAVRAEKGKTMAELQNDQPKSRELVRLAKERAKEKGLLFSAALVEIGRENGDLAAQARMEVLNKKKAWKKIAGYNVLDITDPDTVDLSYVVANLARERAKEKGVNIKQALSEVLREDPDLARRYRAQAVLGIC